MNSLKAFLGEHAINGLLPLQYQLRAAERFEVTFPQVEEAILELGLLPARYQRNRQTVSIEGQRAIFRSRVAVIGCGGLGGYVIEQLARLGVGQIVAIDPDVFEEHNLNRQVLATCCNLGQPKVEAAKERVKEINPAVTLLPLQMALGSANGHELLQQASVAVDALDSITVRLQLAQVCAEMNIPLVHGAIGGWYGQVTTQLPDERSIQKIYGTCAEGKGIEKQLGNPSFTPAVVASLQVAEVCKIVLGEGQLLSGRTLAVDLLAMEFHEMLI